MPTDEQRDGVRWSLATYAQLAEVVASFAVVVTLIFLAGEVRQNTEVTQASFYDQTLGEVNEVRGVFAENPELTRLYAAYLAGEQETTGTADQRLQFMLNWLWGIYEKAYFAHQRGLLGGSEWSRFSRRICIAYRTASGRWERSGWAIKPLLTEEFATFTESSCES